MPVRRTEAHQGQGLAELVCSNSFRSDDPERNAVGLLHEEMRRCGSLILTAADAHKVPAGGALAVDRVGFSEAVEAAVASGLADPRQLVLGGGSWGGYLTLLGLGTQPEAWAVGLAAVPVADYVTAYHDEMEALKSLDRALLGSSPEEVPERYEVSSPLTYVDEVRAPVFISAGVNDPRCPIRQVENYVERLERRGAPHEVYRYDAGHGSLVVEERIKQLRLEIDFALRHLPGPLPAPAGRG